MLNADPARAAASLQSCHALVVEDDVDTCDALSRLLERLGYVTACAGTVAGAIAQLRDTRPDTLILDLALPDGSGVAVLRHLRERGLPIDVAVVSGAADGELLADAVLMHPDAMFTKPADLTEVAAWLGATQARRHAAHPSESTDPTCGPKPAAAAAAQSQPPR